MNTDKRLLLCAVGYALLLSSCGGGGGDDDGGATYRYQGNWYNEKNNTYLQITDNGDTHFYACTINDGFQIIDRLEDGVELNGSILNIGGSEYTLDRSDNNLTATSLQNNAPIEYVLAGFIPSVCEDDAIEITSVSPSTAEQDTLTTFIVNFDYRISSVENVKVYIGFNDEHPYTHYFQPDVELELSGQGLGSTSISAEITPVLYELPKYFSVVLSMFENPLPLSFGSLARDYAKIDVTSSTSISSLSLHEPVRLDTDAQCGDKPPGSLICFNSQPLQ